MKRLLHVFLIAMSSVYGVFNVLMFHDNGPRNELESLLRELQPKLDVFYQSCTNLAGLYRECTCIGWKYDLVIVEGLEKYDSIDFERLTNVEKLLVFETRMQYESFPLNIPPRIFTNLSILPEVFTKHSLRVYIEGNLPPRRRVNTMNNPGREVNEGDREREVIEVECSLL
jgi:hypothetical protein